MKSRISIAIFAGMAALIWTAGCEEQAEEPQDGIKLVSVKLETAGGQVLEKQAESEPVVEPTPAEIPELQLPVNPVVNMATTLGDITIELDLEQAPKTVQNFLQYVDDGFYKGTIFHRVIPGFMIQGGGLTPNLTQKPTRPSIVNESGPALRNKRGTIAMARMTPPNSATCQFFINLVDNPTLDIDGLYAPGYAVFGKVISGMDVVDRIAKVQIRQINPSLTHVPVQPVIIERVERAR